MNASPALPPDLRLYIIGDVHGRLDLLNELLAHIDADSADAKGIVQKIFLGDYVDRGLYSKGVLDALIALYDHEKTKPVFLMGNHEQVMHNLLTSYDIRLLQDWLRFGGAETLLSYGVRPPANTDALPDVMSALMEKTPAAHTAFLAALKTKHSLGDYFFCHAGVRPGTPLDKQDNRDLIWIRQEFIGYKKPYEKMVVHGHTISEKVEFMPNRINIDTGAYATGCLTALVLEGTEKRLLQTGGS